MDIVPVAPTPTPLVPVPLPPRKPRFRILKRIAIIIVILAVVLAALAASWYFIGAAAWSVFSLPKELRSVTFVSEQASGTVLYTPRAFTYAKESLQGTLVSEDLRGDHTARIMRRPDGMYVLTLDGGEILATSTPIAGVSAAPDGKSVAYAHGTPDSELFTYPYQLPHATFGANAWHVAVANPAAHTNLDIGPGTAPLYLDPTHVAYFAPAGILMADFSTGSTTMLLPGHFDPASIATLQSPDHTLVAWRQIAPARLIQVYRIGVNKVTLIAQLPYAGAASYVLGNDAVYTLSLKKLGGAVWRQGFTEPSAHQVASLPATLTITRLLLGVL